MTPEVRRQVRARFGFACGYCGVNEASAGAELTVDHFRPLSRGGTDDLENLVYACPACNQFKGDYWFAEGDSALLHPLTSDFSEHSVERNDVTLAARSLRGLRHIEVLHLNRPELIAYRLAVRARTEERRLIDALEQALSEAETRLEALERQLFEGRQ